MVKFLFVGDLHLRGTNPRNRIDDYKEAAKQKLKEVFKIAVDNAVDAILQRGYIRPAGSWYSRSSGICGSVKGKSSKYLLYPG